MFYIEMKCRITVNKKLERRGYSTTWSDCEKLQKMSGQLVTVPNFETRNTKLWHSKAPNV
jgi:hypothetical protein